MVATFFLEEGSPSAAAKGLFGSLSVMNVNRERLISALAALVAAIRRHRSLNICVAVLVPSERSSV
jgi:hypothetical protein